MFCATAHKARDIETQLAIVAAGGCVERRYTAWHKIPDAPDHLNGETKVKPLRFALALVIFFLASDFAKIV